MLRINSSIKNRIPNLITFIRIILAPIFFFSVLNYSLTSSIIIFTLTIITDGLDGYLARHLNSTSVIGAYLDVTADFIFILSGFLAFVVLGVYPTWLLIIIIFMFLQFIITSKFKIPSYDPVGKYYGSFLFLTIIISLIFSLSSINTIILLLIIGFSVISMTSRILYLLKHGYGKN